MICRMTLPRWAALLAGILGLPLLVSCLDAPTGRTADKTTAETLEAQPRGYRFAPPPDYAEKITFDLDTQVSGGAPGPFADTRGQRVLISGKVHNGGELTITYMEVEITLVDNEGNTFGPRTDLFVHNSAVGVNRGFLPPNSSKPVYSDIGGVKGWTGGKVQVKIIDMEVK
jgi:hypothetical protein